jgi:hypothetical protein
LTHGRRFFIRTANEERKVLPLPPDMLPELIVRIFAKILKPRGVVPILWPEGLVAHLTLDSVEATTTLFLHLRGAYVENYKADCYAVDNAPAFDRLEHVDVLVRGPRETAAGLLESVRQVLCAALTDLWPAFDASDLREDALQVGGTDPDLFHPRASRQSLSGGESDAAALSLAASAADLPDALPQQLYGLDLADVHRMVDGIVLCALVVVFFSFFFQTHVF